MKTLALSAFLLCTLAIFAVPGTASAQDNDITRDQVQSFYKNLNTLFASHLNLTDDTTQEQVDSVVDEITYYYDKDATIILSSKVLKDGRLHHIGRASGEMKMYKKFLEQIPYFVKDLESKYRIKNIELRGQRAIVEIVYVYDFSMARDDYNDIIKDSWDVKEKVECEDHLTLTERNQLIITHTDCASKARTANYQIHQMPKFMEHYDLEEQSIYYLAYQ